MNWAIKNIGFSFVAMAILFIGLAALTEYGNRSDAIKEASRANIQRVTQAEYAARISSAAIEEAQRALQPMQGKVLTRKGMDDAARVIKAKVRK
jgi:hypothetical protein